MSLFNSQPPLSQPQPLVTGNQLYFHNEDRNVPVVANAQGPSLRREGEKGGMEEFARGWVGQFDLGNTLHAQQYNQIINAAAKGVVVLCREEASFNQATGNWIVFARWMERYYAEPSRVHSGAYRNGHGQLCFKD